MPSCHASDGAVISMLRPHTKVKRRGAVACLSPCAFSLRTCADLPFPMALCHTLADIIRCSSIRRATRPSGTARIKSRFSSRFFGCSSRFNSRFFADSEGRGLSRYMTA